MSPKSGSSAPDNIHMRLYRTMMGHCGLYWARMGCGIVHKAVGGHRELHMPPVMAHHSLFYFSHCSLSGGPFRPGVYDSHTGMGLIKESLSSHLLWHVVN